MKKILFLAISLLVAFTINLNAQEYHLGQVVTNPDGSQGVVFYLNEDGTDGWMVALHDVGLRIPWGLNDHVPELGPVVIINNDILTTVFSDRDGYTNTMHIREHYENIGYTGPYAAKLVDFENGWYLPAAGQLKMLYVNAIFYEPTLRTVGETMGLNAYWSSTVQNDEKAWYVQFGAPYAMNAWAWNGFFSAMERESPIDHYDRSFAVRAIRNLDFSPTPAIGQLQAPAVICGEGSLELVLPHLFHIDTYGWEISPDETFSSPIPYTGQELDKTYNDWYLRLWATAENEVLYSNAVKISVHEISTSDEFIETCDPYDWNGQTYTETGDYQTVLTDQWGCDSVANLHLTVNDPDEYFVPIPVFACETYTWGDQTYTESGAYQQTFTNQHGCDSIVTMSLFINHDVEHQFMDICCNEYNWNGVVYTESGVYQQVLTATNGCDSIVTLSLTVKHTPPVSEIEGEVNIYYQENGVFTYSIEPVLDCFGYEWSIDNHWQITPNGNECAVHVNTVTAGDLKVKVYTECGFVERTITIHHDYLPSVVIYHNPNQGDFNMILGGMKGEAVILVYDYLGRLLDRISIDTNVEGITVPYSLGDKAVGVYLVRVINDSSMITKRVVKWM